MVEAAKSLFLILSALFPIVDPLGGSPIFLSMTRDYSPAIRKELSWRIAMNSFFCWSARILSGRTFCASLEFRSRWCKSAADSS